MRRLVLVWAGVTLPAAAGVVTALVLALAGVRTQLEVAVGLPGLVAAGGILLSLAALWAVVITRARTRRERELASARDAAVTEGRELERAAHRRFLARLDHELKNPVTAIRATIAADSDPQAGPRGALAVIDAQATRLATLVGELRKLAELETRPLDLEIVDLEHLVADSIEGLAALPDARARVTLTVTRVPWPVPPLNADPDLLAVAVDNVLANALKFGDGPVEVRVREDDGWAVVEVADAGRGIPADDTDAVFDELARARNARDVGGSGIGLSLVRTVLRRHGGEVELRSREGEGTVITLRLPAT
ncbi:MAG: HAMP domain-containing histidine kinase [Micrococcales bacterium]|nr:HAMP domain-containing histidine kinase [Micrococcales bacterium]